MGNHAVNINPPILNGVLADIHITRRGSDWLWAVFSIFGFTTLLFLFAGLRRPATDRVFHYITTAIVAVAAITYFTTASDLGFVPIAVEWQRGGKVSGAFRQIFYVRYIDWFITTPLLLLDLLLTAGLPWSQILFVIFMDLITVVCGLVGALVTSTYKWGYFTLGCATFTYVLYTLVGPARAHAAFHGSDVSRAYNSSGLLLIFIWILYPIAWGCSEGGNVITPDSESVFYGILDILSKVGFGVIFLWGHRGIDPARLGLRLRAYDDPISGATGTHSEKNGHTPIAPATNV